MVEHPFPCILRLLAHLPGNVLLHIFDAFRYIIQCIADLRLLPLEPCRNIGTGRAQICVFKVQLRRRLLCVLQFRLERIDPLFDYRNGVLMTR